MSGKGDKPRPVDPKKWDENWERIFKHDRTDEFLRRVANFAATDGAARFRTDDELTKICEIIENG